MGKSFEPVFVQKMVDNKQYQHSGAQPLMDLLLGQHKGHEKEQQDCHQYIHREFKSLFCIHHKLIPREQSRTSKASYRRAIIA